MNESDLFYLKTDWAGWTKVTKEEFVSAERAAGFRNTMGRPLEPATGGFSGGGVHGATVNMKYAKPEQYDWDPEFRKAVWGE
jgi:hypothetical protein